MDYIKPPYKNKLGIPVVDYFNINDYYKSDIDRGITSIKCRQLDRFTATGIYIEKYYQNNKCVKKTKLLTL